VGSLDEKNVAGKKVFGIAYGFSNSVRVYKLKMGRL
jgi:hypothetical protein